MRTRSIRYGVAGLAAAGLLGAGCGFTSPVSNGPGAGVGDTDEAPEVTAPADELAPPADDVTPPADDVTPPDSTPDLDVPFQALLGG
jgi:hypothetical protein